MQENSEFSKTEYSDIPTIEEYIKPNEQRAKTAIILLWIVLAIEVVSSISDFFQYKLLQAGDNGVGISPEVATANDTRQQLIGIAYLIAYIISAITFIQWFRRAYFNLHTKVNHLTHTEGWAAGSWFVPIANLFRPYQIMKELYQETETLLTKRTENYTKRTSTSLLGWWWTLWIIWNIIGQFTFRYTLKAETINELTVSTIISMIGSILCIPLGLITIKVIKDYSTVEPLLYNLKNENIEETTSNKML